MINNVVLVGRLTKDAELRYTQSGAAVASFTLAVNRRFKSEGQPEADFINCVIWNKSAETLANHTGKGSQIGIEGRIQTRTYEDAEGKTRYVTEVVAENFSFLESKREESTPEPQPQKKPYPPKGNYQKGGYKK